VLRVGPQPMAVTEVGLALEPGVVRVALVAQACGDHRSHGALPG
jgi:hypothetical protein